MSPVIQINCVSSLLWTVIRNALGQSEDFSFFKIQTFSSESNRFEELLVHFRPCTLLQVLVYGLEKLAVVYI